MPAGGELASALGDVAGRLGAVDPWLLTVAVLFHVANHALRSLAWRNVLQAAYPDARVRFGGIAVAYAVGVALNAVVPARGGDAAKAGLVRAEIRDSSIATIAATMSVLVLFDMLAGTVLIGVVALGGGSLALDLPSWTWLEGNLAVPGLLAVAAAVTGWFAARRARAVLARLARRIRQGGAILRTPHRYVTRVALVQTAAWGCRIAVVMCLLAAFGLPASPAVAGLVMVLAGVSTVVPLTPGGAGTQQALMAYALSGAASAAAIVSFSVGMQVAVTAVNALLGVGAAMVAFRTLRPMSAVRAGLRAARAGASA